MIYVAIIIHSKVANDFYLEGSDGHGYWWRRSGWSKADLTEHCHHQCLLEMDDARYVFGSTIRKVTGYKIIFWPIRWPNPPLLLQFWIIPSAKMELLTVVLHDVYQEEPFSSIALWKGQVSCQQQWQDVHLNFFSRQLISSPSSRAVIKDYVHNTTAPVQMPNPSQLLQLESPQNLRGITSSHNQWHCMPLPWVYLLNSAGHKSLGNQVISDSWADRLVHKIF